VKIQTKSYELSLQGAIAVSKKISILGHETHEMIGKNTSIIHTETSQSGLIFKQN
jgi:hypothetical protein